MKHSTVPLAAPAVLYHRHQHSRRQGLYAPALPGQRRGGSSTVAPRALSPWCGAAAPRALLALPSPAGLLPPLVAGLKSKTSLKRRCKDCFMVRRRGRLYVLCKTNPRHKQRQL
uniref:Ribosomal protein n=1 Tax=Strigops habroptila TaxID=2489341 RepID=A0A672TT28_STRHB